MLKMIVDSLDEVDSQYQHLYQEKDGKFYLQVEGVEFTPVVKQLKDEAAKSRIKARDLEEKLKPFLALGDVAELQAQLDRIPELEAASGGKVDDAKLNELAEARIRTKLAPLERELTQLKTQLGEKDGIIANYKDRDIKLSIADAIRGAAKKSTGFQETAIEDAIVLGERIFTVGEDGTVSAKDGVGVTPGIDPVVWLTEMQPKRPHWWGPSEGGGATGGRTGAGGGPNPWTHEHWNMTEQGRIYNDNPQRAEQMAKSAGTTIGGQRPAPRK